MGIQIGSITIYYYGIIIMLGALAAAGFYWYLSSESACSLVALPTRHCLLCHVYHVYKVSRPVLGDFHISQDIV